MYIELLSDGIQKSCITLSGDKMKLDGIANFTRTEKEGYETSNNKEISINLQKRSISKSSFFYTNLDNLAMMISRCKYICYSLFFN